MWMTACTAEEETETTITTSATAATYDAEAAARYGADDYGMKKYVLALLKTGPNRDQGPEEAQRLQQAHMANIDRMAADGKLVLAGPFIGEGDLRGLYVFDVASVEEARELTMSDPAIQAGSLVMELYPWYGSAAVMAINDIHNRVSKPVE